MCITVNLTLKQAFVVCVCIALAITSGLLYGKIVDNRVVLNNIETVNCTLISTYKYNNTEQLVHSNWKYNYNDKTYIFSKQTTYVPKSHMCCLSKLNPFIIIKCVDSIMYLYALYMGFAWVVSLVMFYCMFSQPHKKKETIINQTQLSDITRQIDV